MRSCLCRWPGLNVYDGISGVGQGHWGVFWGHINGGHISEAVRRGRSRLSVAQKPQSDGGMFPKAWGIKALEVRGLHPLMTR